MDYRPFNSDKGPKKCPVLLENVFACSWKNTCKTADCIANGGQHVPTIEAEVKNNNIVVFCYAGAK